MLVRDLRLLYIVIVRSQGAILKGSPEHVLLKDRQVLRVFRPAAAKAVLHDYVFHLT